MSVRVPADKRFRRAQPRSGRRRRWRALIRWRTLRLIGLLTVVSYGGYRAAELALGASLLHVSRITVRGNVRLSVGEVHALLTGLRKANILTADLDGYRARVLDSPWVERATLRRVLPSTIEVAIVERRPIGLCRVGSHLYLIDARGVLIDEFGPQYASFDLPIIDGLVSVPAEGRPLVDEVRAELAARLLHSVGVKREIAQRISQIDVRDPHDAIVILDGDPALLHVGDDRFLERLQSYAELSPALRARVPDIDYVDLRFDERVYVRPRGTAGRSP